MDRHAGPGRIRLIEADHFPQLLKAIELGTTFHRFKGIVFKKHPVTHRVHDFLFGLEVVVYRAFCEAAQFLDNILNRGILIPFF